jgi:hypothetical protein
MTVWPTLRPYIPRNLTLFSLDDYHPAWMYPSSHCSGTTGPLCKRCRDGGWPRPPGCDNETEGLWVYPRYQASVFAPGRLGPDTKVLVVPHCRFVPPLIHFIPGSLTISVPLFLKRQCDRTRHQGAGRAADVRQPQPVHLRRALGLVHQPGAIYLEL